MPMPEEVEVDRAREVRLRWADGMVWGFDLELVRRHCPCAECRGRRERGEQPGVGAELRITDAQLVGAWGLGLTWQDGHSTGIYPWEMFRAWAEAGAGHQIESD